MIENPMARQNGVISRPARPSLVRRFLRYLDRLWQPQPPLLPQEEAPEQEIRQLVRQHDLTPPIVVPARGGAFHFFVDVALCWRADGLPADVLDRWIRWHCGTARRRVRQFARELARDCPPHQGQELERRLHTAVAARSPWHFPCDGVDITCYAEIRVRLDDRVRQVVQPLWERRVVMECEHENALRRAELAERLSQRWLAVLGELTRHPQANAAATLTEAELADVVSRSATERNANEQRWHDHLDRLLSNSAGIDLFERDQILGLLRSCRPDTTTAPAPPSAAPPRTPAEPGRGWRD